MKEVTPHVNYSKKVSVDKNRIKHHRIHLDKSPRREELGC